MTMLSAVRRFLPHNVGLKLLALSLALLVYGSVYLDREHEAVISMPLIVDNQNDERVLLDRPPDRAMAKVVARGRLLLRLRFTRLQHSDLATVLRIGPGEELFDRALTVNDVLIPLSLDLRVSEIVEPKRLTLRLDETLERVLPVVVRTKGKVPQGYVLNGSMSLDPDEVTVVGPKTLLTGLEAVATEAVVLDDRTEPFTDKVPVLVDARLQSRPSIIRVSMDVERTTQVRLGPVPVIVRNARQYVARVEPDSGTVVLLGPRSRLQRLSTLHSRGESTGLVIVIDAGGLPPGEHDSTPIVELTPELRLVAIEPARFRLLLSTSEASRP